ncbi:MAG: hypothetical protein U0R81_06275 [Mycobacterium sp.]
MITKTPLAAIGATAAALAIPAMLFLGAGTGHAAPGVAVWTNSAPGGVDVSVQTDWGDQGLSGWCTYTSTVQGNPIGKPLPALGVPFYIAPEGPHFARLWFPSYPTGSNWNVTVTCPNGVASTQTVW